MTKICDTVLFELLSEAKETNNTLSKPSKLNGKKEKFTRSM